jgi:hypothetical protein
MDTRRVLCLSPSLRVPSVFEGGSQGQALNSFNFTARDLAYYVYAVHADLPRIYDEPQLVSEVHAGKGGKNSSRFLFRTKLKSMYPAE